MKSAQLNPGFWKSDTRFLTKMTQTSNRPFSELPASWVFIFDTSQVMLQVFTFLFFL